MFAWPPKMLLVHNFACLVDAGMIYYLIGYGNMPFLEMIVKCYKESQNSVLHLIKLFWVYYETNVPSVDLLYRIPGNWDIFNFFLTVYVTPL